VLGLEIGDNVQNMKLRASNAELLDCNQQFQELTEELQIENSHLQEVNANLTDEVTYLKNELAELRLKVQAQWKSPDFFVPPSDSLIGTRQSEPLSRSSIYGHQNPNLVKCYKPHEVERDVIHPRLARLFKEPVEEKEPHPRLANLFESPEDNQPNTTYIYEQPKPSRRYRFSVDASDLKEDSGRPTKSNNCHRNRERRRR